MSKTWLLLDCPNLCWRSFHVFGPLSHDGNPIGVIYGFLRDLDNLMTRYNTRNVVFCFDFGESLRKKIYPEYKANRKSKTVEEESSRILAHHQISELRAKILPELGFKNIFFQEGYEADDGIAVCVRETSSTDNRDYVIVSNDSDLYQLLSERVVIDRGKHGGLVTRDTFIREYCIYPDEWPKIKILSGCKSDNIQGIPGIGEKTALILYQGKLRAGKKLEKINQNISEIVKRNSPLVKLPYPGMKSFKPKKDEFSPQKWRKVLKEYGIKSLR